MGTNPNGPRNEVICTGKLGLKSPARIAETNYVGSKVDVKLTPCTADSLPDPDPDRQVKVLPFRFDMAYCQPGFCTPEVDKRYSPVALFLALDFRGAPGEVFRI